jgi:hypothetical protein
MDGVIGNQHPISTESEASNRKAVSVVTGLVCVQLLVAEIVPCMGRKIGRN